jgi:hypothetical protein
MAERPESAATSSGYLLDDREALLAAAEAAGVVPHHETVTADHVTYQAKDPDPAPPARSFRATGWVRSHAVDALVGEVDGHAVRPDGGRYHVTLSVAPGHHGRESNDAIAAGPVHPLSQPIEAPVTRF